MYGPIAEYFKSQPVSQSASQSVSRSACVCVCYFVNYLVGRFFQLLCELLGWSVFPSLSYISISKGRFPVDQSIIIKKQNVWLSLDCSFYHIHLSQNRMN